LLCLVSHLGVLARIRISVRIDPYPLKSIDGCLLAGLLDFAVAFDVADVGKFHVFPLLKINFLLIPGVGKNGIWWDLVIGDEVFYLPILRAEESHVGRSTKQNDLDIIC